MQQIQITYSLMKFLFASGLTWSSLAFHDDELVENDNVETTDLSASSSVGVVTD